jgi:heterodisulfide reductase subunit B
MLDAIANKAMKKLGGLPIACYYGCLSLRNPRITDASNWERPETLEGIISAVGAKPVAWSHRTECCSGSLTMARPDIARKLVGDIADAAKRAGAVAMVTDCPMCQANVESRQLDNMEAGSHLPVFFATELIAAALNGDYPKAQQKVHLIAPDVLTNFFLYSNASKEGSA